MRLNSSIQNDSRESAYGNINRFFSCTKEHFKIHRVSYGICTEISIPIIAIAFSFGFIEGSRNLKAFVAILSIILGGTIGAAIADRLPPIGGAEYMPLP